jgi:hypothetical protein
MEREAKEEKLLKYLEALESVNYQLLNALKRCVELLNQVQPPAPERNRWQGILDDLEGIIQSAEKVYRDKTVH